MKGDFLGTDRGSVTTDWVVLTAGILLLGMVVTYAVMHDSAGYLMAEFEELNQEYSTDSSNSAATLGGTAQGVTYSDQ